jgi:hypothetical protein
MNKHRIEHCPIRRNLLIRDLLVKKTKEAGYNQKEVVDDAVAFGMPLTKEIYSSYLNSFDPLTGDPIEGHYFPSMETVLWLCARWGIDVSLLVTEMNLPEEELRRRARKFSPKTFIKKRGN